MRAIQENQECALNSITVGIDKIRLPNGTPSLEPDANSLTWNKKMLINNHVYVFFIYITNQQIKLGEK